jgi:hypothetical protein
MVFDDTQFAASFAWKALYAEQPCTGGRIDAGERR